MRLEDFLGVNVDLDEVARWVRNGDDLEGILTRLRDMGCDVPGCIAVLDAAGVMSLSEAKVAVVFSETWKDELPQNRAFRRHIGELLEGETESDADPT
ncbi:hypothetical protein B0I31_109117 [Saccharothrix carnea]|uniref:Uncharacterized protein n=1 Tax=Saccharothrix carnea TaxID=1280637 RepID=A0A2P8I4C9_SACCR|nr:hypothetical protein [Saccharothrix carnea]PSL53327.1 hypothetical protein B0I31_109117 [Saccharothrix carnea]